MDDLLPRALWRYARMRGRLAFARLLHAIWRSGTIFAAFLHWPLLAGLNCVAVMILMRQRAGGLPLSMTNWRLCVAAVAAAGLTIASRWLLARIESEPPAFRIRVFLAAVSVFPLVVLLTVATPQFDFGGDWTSRLLAVAAGNANLLWNRWQSAKLEASRDAGDRPVEPTRLSCASFPKRRRLF